MDMIKSADCLPTIAAACHRPESEFCVCDNGGTVMHWTILCFGAEVLNRPEFFPEVRALVDRCVKKLNPEQTAYLKRIWQERTECQIFIRNLFTWVREKAFAQSPIPYSEKDHDAVIEAYQQYLTGYVGQRISIGRLGPGITGDMRAQAIAAIIRCEEISAYYQTRYVHVVVENDALVRHATNGNLNEP